MRARRAGTAAGRPGGRSPTAAGDERAFKVYGYAADHLTPEELAIALGVEPRYT